MFSDYYRCSWIFSGCSLGVLGCSQDVLRMFSGIAHIRNYRHYRRWSAFSSYEVSHFANTVQPHWAQDQTPCRNGQLCQWDLTNISNILIVVTFDLWTPRVWSRNRFFSEPQLLVAIDFTDGATLFVKLVYYCYTDSILLEWVEVNQRHKRWWNQCNLGKKTQIEKPARLTIVPDCETSAATPWERLQEK